VELARLLEYTAQRLKRDDVTDLVMLRELLAKLGGVESLADAGEGALDAQAGCWALRFEVRIPPHTHTHIEAKSHTERQTRRLYVCMSVFAHDVCMDGPAQIRRPRGLQSCH
jgi:hypothetical protein